MLCYKEEFLSRGVGVGVGVEPFGGAIPIFLEVKGMISDFPLLSACDTSISLIPQFDTPIMCS